MDTETVTLELPESLYRTAPQVAEATQQPLDAVLQASIAHTLPPLDDVSTEEVAALAALALLDDGALWRACSTCVEHIIPVAAGGASNEENLWLACPLCNGFSGWH